MNLPDVLTKMEATTKKLDELFKQLLENGPISKNLIEESHTDYIKLKETALQQKEKQIAIKDVHVCPHCGKKVPKIADEEFEKMKKELALKRDNNGPLIDLNSPNMVKLIGEKYMELYDNEWTQAFGFLDNTMNLREDKVLDTLQRILRAAYAFCNDIAKAQLENMEGEIYCPLSTWTEDARVELMDHKISIPPNTSRLAKTYRKTASYESIPAIQNAFVANILSEFMDPALYNDDKVLDYVRKCVEISWYMCVQDVPMILVSKVNRRDPFDENLFRHYNRSGDKYDFVVWPALLLSEGGPIVTKGVAQPWDPSRSVGNLKEAAAVDSSRVPTGRKSNPPTTVPERRPSRQSQINPALRGSTPWGDHYYSNRGTPSVDLPPLPAQNVSPTRVDPSTMDPTANARRTPQGLSQRSVLTGAWKK